MALNAEVTQIVFDVKDNSFKMSLHYKNTINQNINISHEEAKRAINNLGFTAQMDSENYVIYYYDDKK